MSVRLLLTDEIWKTMQSVLNEIKSKVGRPPVISDRLFIEAVLYVARTGIPWRDLPDSFGHFSAIYNRLRRWKLNGTLTKLWEQLETYQIPLADNLFIDSTCVRAHQHAAGAAKATGGQQQQALGRSVGGLSSKIHLGCLDEKNAISVVLTGGQVPDVKEFDAVFEQLPENHGLKNAIMDKGYDSNSVRETLSLNEIAAVIPPKTNRTTEIDFDKQLYKLRNKVERFINRIKQFRRIATRYDKLAKTYLVFIHIVAVYVMLS